MSEKIASQLQSGNHEDLFHFLGDCEIGGHTPWIWGTFAIGKSEVVERYARSKAEAMGRNFVIWHKLPFKEKVRLFEDANLRSKSYILYDNRAASNDSTDDKGIPNITNPEYLAWVQSLIFKVFELPETEGLLFNDEITLAPTMVQNSMYKMVYDKAIGDISFNERIFVVCAGNRASDRAFVQETPMPLRTRVIHFLLDPATPEKQITWFIENDIDDRVVAFYSAHPELIFHWNEDSEEFTASTPRTIKFLSDLIKPLQYPKDGRRIRILACGAVGTYTGSMFMKFLDASKELNIDEFLKNPSKAKDLVGLDEKFGLISLASRKYGDSKDAKKRMAILNKTLDIYEYLDPEIAVLMIRMLYAKRIQAFRKDIIKCPKWKKISPKIGKYIM